MIPRIAIAFATLAAPSLAETPVSSQVEGLAITALDTLPASKAAPDATDSCGHLLLASVETPAGRAAQAKNWFVTAELPLGDLTAVSFIASYSPSTSGTCELVDGNVGIFAGDTLVALVYAAEADSALIGSIKPFGESGLRVFSGDIVPTPVADLQLGSDGALTVLPLAPAEPVCNGAASVPNIYNLPVDKARVALAAAGWQPLPGSTESQSFSQAKDLAAAGIIEVEDCAGTGFGFCAYRYSGPAGELGVVSVGEIGEDGILPTVVSYSVDCR